jgi:hypothetical protein
VTNDGGQGKLCAFTLWARSVEPVGCKKIAAWHGSPFPKGASKIDGEVRLTDEQAALCRTLLCQELMKASNLLASGKDCNGRKLIDQTKQSLMVFSSRLQLTLLALGMTSRELADIVKSF